MREEKQGNIFYKTPVITMTNGYFKDMYDFDSFLPEWKRLRLVDGAIVYEPRWFHQILEDDARKSMGRDRSRITSILFIIAKGLLFVLLLVLVKIFITIVVMFKRSRCQNAEKLCTKYDF
jgi:hypothetical protein